MMTLDVSTLTDAEVEILALAPNDDPGRKYKSSDVLAACPICNAAFWQRSYLVNGERRPATCGLRCGQRHRAELEGRGGLTKREAELCTLLVQGLTNEAIAARMGISPGTLRNMVSSVYRKTN